MGGRVAAGFARFAGPAAMGIAGAAGSMAPAIIGIAVAGKVLGIVGAVAGVVAVALNKLADSAIAATVRISKYDARLASAGAMLDIGRTIRDIRMAQATGRTGSELLAAQDRFENTWLPVSIAIQDLSNKISTAWINLKGLLTEKIAIPLIENADAQRFAMKGFAGVLDALRNQYPVVVTILEQALNVSLKQLEKAEQEARRKEIEDRRKAGMQMVNNLNHMLDAAARRAPFYGESWYLKSISAVPTPRLSTTGSSFATARR
jgi:hypothetical protein